MQINSDDRIAGCGQHVSVFALDGFMTGLCFDGPEGKCDIVTHFSEKMLVILIIGVSSRNRDDQHSENAVLMRQTHRQAAPVLIALGQGTLDTLFRGIVDCQDPVRLEC